MTGHEPAFPQPIDDMGTLTAKTEGMSIREYFAAKAMTAILSSTGETQVAAHKLPWVTEGKSHPIWAAQCAVVYADALIQALNEKQP